MSKKDPVRHNFYRLFDSDHGHSMSEDILSCEDQTSPDRKTSSVKKFCGVSFDLDAPVESLKTFTNSNGEAFKRLDYVLEMVPSGATLEFNLYIGGRKQGSENTQVDYLR